jgi:hypothetical protein
LIRLFILIVVLRVSKEAFTIEGGAGTLLFSSGCLILV